MRTNIYWLDDSQSGRIGIMPRPRGGDWLEDEIRALRDIACRIHTALPRYRFRINSNFLLCRFSAFTKSASEPRNSTLE
jgi:hypothetical protein